jgi:hypothetical protein
MRWTEPQDWDSRLISRFLVFPRTINGETRWLERCWIGQVWHDKWGWEDWVWDKMPSRPPPPTHDMRH